MQITRWDQYTVDFTIRDQDWEVVDLTGTEVRFTVRQKRTLNDDDDTTALIAKTIDEFETPLTGVVSIPFLSADTADIIPGDYFYDIQVKFDNGDIISQPVSIFSITQDVTKDISTI